MTAVETAREEYEAAWIQGLVPGGTQNYPFILGRVMGLNAALEAENEGLRTLRDGWVRVCKQHDQILGDSAIEWEDHAQRLLARLSRQCATCSNWNHGHGDDGDVVNYCRQLDHAIPRDFGCNRWAEKGNS